MSFDPICLQESRLYPADWPVLKVDMNTVVTVNVELIEDSDGSEPIEPVQLQNKTLVFVANDRFQNVQNMYFNKDMVIDDEAKGLAHIDFLDGELFRDGLFLAQIVMLENGVELRRFPAYLEVAGDLFDTTSKGGLTIAELRYYIRDRWDGENYLLDSVEFSDTDIAMSMRRAVDQWNETAPFLRPKYSVETFPYREALARGTISKLLSTAVHNLTRNRMQYQVTGATLDDQSRTDDYRKMAFEEAEMYRAWILRTKKALNMAGFFGRTEIPEYGNGYWGGNRGNNNSRPLV